MTITFDCFWTDPPHRHEYPDDWQFGGPYKTDPRADPRWESTVYVYYDADTRELWRTVKPICDDEALDDFSLVAQVRGSNPRYISVKRPGQKEVMMPFEYDKATDTVYPMEAKQHA